MARAEKTVVLNVRITERQARWLRNVAEEQHSDNVSEAVRQAITDSWMLRRCRDDYEVLRSEGFRFPPYEDGSVRSIELFLSRILKGMTWDEEDVKWV